MKEKVGKEDATFYYQREEETNHPRVTICILSCGDNLSCRGLAICSPSKLSIDKKYGRRVAFGRAMNAYYNGSDSSPIGRPNAVETLHSCKTPFPCKSQFNVELTPFEISLL